MASSYRTIFTCEECARTFTSVSNLKRHLREIHGGGQEENGCGGNFQCMLCDQILKNYDSYTLHSKDNHQCSIVIENKNFETFEGKFNIAPLKIFT